MAELERGVWQRFDHDPRLPSHAHLRASDLDRDVIADVLATAYAEGRLDRDELDERSDRLRATKTLGELPDLVADLVVDRSAPRPAVRSMRREAEERYAARRNAALWSFLVPTVICWVIWVSVLLGGGGTAFPWPVFVTLGTGAGWFRMLTAREAQIAELERHLEEKQLRREERRRRRLEGPS